MLGGTQYYTLGEVDLLLLSLNTVLLSLNKWRRVHSCLVLGRLILTVRIMIGKGKFREPRFVSDNPGRCVWGPS